MATSQETGNLNTPGGSLRREPKSPSERASRADNTASLTGKTAIVVGGQLRTRIAALKRSSASEQVKTWRSS